MNCNSELSEVQQTPSGEGDSVSTATIAKQTEGSRASARLTSLHKALEKRGFAVRVDDELNPSRLAATRGLVGKFAPMLVHLSMIMVMAGAAAGLLFGASSEVLIGDGGLADMGRVLQQGRRNIGPFYEWGNPMRGLMETSLLQVEDFRIEYKDDGAVNQFYSKLAIQDSRTKERLFADEIYVNNPMRYGGSTIYQADWSIDRLQMYLNGVGIVVPLKQLPDSAGSRAWAAFLPEELMTAKDPNSVKKIANPNEGVVLVVENMRNVQVYGSNKELAGILRNPSAKIDQKMEEKRQNMPVQFGESITVEGSELRLDRIVGATGLIIKNDPGVPLVYLGFALLMPAVLLSVLPFGQVWAAVGEEDRNQLVIGGKSNRNLPAFEDEMKAMVLSTVA